MAFSVLRSLRNAKPKSFNGLSKRKTSSKSRSRRYGTSASSGAQLSESFNNMGQAVGASFSKWWAGLGAAPIVFGAFWGSSNTKKNDLDSLVDDVEKLDAIVENGSDPEVRSLLEKIINKIQAFPDSEIARDPGFVAQTLGSVALLQESLNMPDSVQTVELLNKILERLDAEENFPEAVRVAHQAQFYIAYKRGQTAEAKSILLRDLEFIKRLEETNASPEQSSVLFTLATVCALDDDPAVNNYLGESIKLFNGITAATLAPEIEKFWIGQIMNSLQFGITIEDHPKASKEFKRVAKTLYDQLKRISPNKADIPEWKELEQFARKAIEAENGSA